MKIPFLILVSLLAAGCGTAASSTSTRPVAVTSSSIPEPTSVPTEAPTQAPITLAPALTKCPPKPYVNGRLMDFTFRAAGGGSFATRYLFAVTDGTDKCLISAKANHTGITTLHLSEMHNILEQGGKAIPVDILFEP